MTDLRFYSCDLRTGRLAEELPFAIESDLSRYIGTTGAGMLSLDVTDKSTPREWEAYTQGWRTLIVACAGDQGRILWGGVPTRSRRDVTGRKVQIPCVTLEGYLDRRYVPTRSFTGADQTSDVAAYLAGLANAAPGIGLTIDTRASGVLIDAEYFADESRPASRPLIEAANADNGFEWAIYLDWSPDKSAVVKTFRTGYPVLGSRAEYPHAAFALPGNITGGTFEEVWDGEEMATHVVATGTGEGDDVVTSPAVIDTAREGNGWPRLELRKSFPNQFRAGALRQYARGIAADVFGGGDVLSLSVNLGAAELAEWDLGDTVQVSIQGDTLRLDEPMRVTGWSLSTDMTTLRPVLQRIEP